MYSDNNNNAVLNKRSQNTAAMISKEDQSSWLKIECARGRNARQYYEGLQKACSEYALPYCTIARWVKAFKEGRQNMTDMPWPGHSAVREDVMQTVNMLVLVDRWAWEVLYLPLYSQDLSPCDYNIIPKMKEPFHGTRFRTVHDILQATDHSLCNIQRLRSANSIQQLPHCWERVIHNGGGYIEGL